MEYCGGEVGGGRFAGAEDGPGRVVDVGGPLEEAVWVHDHLFDAGGIRHGEEIGVFVFLGCDAGKDTIELLSYKC